MTDRPPMSARNEAVEQVIRSLEVRTYIANASHEGSGDEDTRYDTTPGTRFIAMHACVEGTGCVDAGRRGSIPMHAGSIACVVVAGDVAAIEASHRAGTGHASVAGIAGTACSIQSAILQVSCGPLSHVFESLRQPLYVPPAYGIRGIATFRQAMDELAAAAVGAEAMASVLLKQVLIVCLRALLEMDHPWLDELSLARDRNIARAYALMSLRPGDRHSVGSLASVASLSRSAFMARFLAATGCSPMVVLRQLRMRRAADLLRTQALSFEQVARMVGYRSSSSFCRAFYGVHGYEPRALRTNPQATPSGGLWDGIARPLARRTARA
ncbi:helix-turn-helix transcriptional regulator [Bacillus sp. NP157]|nr:helix-turn-helix transcriptional regulator [Bacillus sp. NP157]